MNTTMPQPQLQPQAQPQMVVNPGAVVQNAEHEWSHGLCDCFGACGTCCYSFWCPCIVFGKSKQRHEHLGTKGVPDPEHGGCCSMNCCLYAGLAMCGFAWVLQTLERQSLREQYRIRGGGCTDCLASYFCTPCALTQESRELDIEESKVGRY